VLSLFQKSRHTTHVLKCRLFVFLAGLAAGFLPALAFADGIPHAYGIAMQTPGSPLQAYINSYHDGLLWLIAFICVFVLALMLYIVVRFRKSANPVASSRTHNVPLEIIWTLIPTLILLVIFFVWSMPLLYYGDRIPQKADLTLKVTGHQWYWSYEYPDNNDIGFDSHAIWDSSDVTQADADKLIADASQGWLLKDAKPLRMLEVDNRLVLPVGKYVRVQITGADVEHSWYVPSLGVNRMAVPGRLNEVWLKIDHEGLYYGQCSMICGNGHGFMPIVIEGVSPEKFAAWVLTKKSNVGDDSIHINMPQYAALKEKDTNSLGIQ
jgi:cytochrome c oxidase subunit 2